MASKPSSDLAALYALRPSEFTRHRNAQAAELRRQGRTEEATAVRRLKKPSLALWAVNALAREQAGAVRAFAEATDRLKRVQLGGREPVAGATDARRRALDVLLRAADAILAREGFEAASNTRERISDTLVGAAADRDTRRALLEGRLTEERQAPGFDVLSGLRIAPPAARRTERPIPPQDERRRQEERRARDRATVARRAPEAPDADRERAAELARKARALETAAEARAREAAGAARVVQELQQQLRQAKARAREQRRTARAAALAATRARQHAERLAAKLRG
ncbi:MAG TPA: hypothetical protein VFD84_09505 [Candidatus Binatia bacterium]|nr:hypothetical protein [Candidatus Binatia bacterium]